MEQLIQEVQKEQMRKPVEGHMDPQELLLKLYQSAIRNVKETIDDLDAGEKTSEELLSLGKAYWIIEYFIDSLDFKLSPDLCADLEGLYHSMMERMTNAYTTMNSEPLIPVLSALEELHLTWEEAVAMSNAENKVAEA